MFKVSEQISIPLSEIRFFSIKSQGPGGQHVNKVATAVHLRLDIMRSSLPSYCKRKLLESNDHRITKDGIVIIKANQHRSLEKNKEEALKRLQKLIRLALVVPKKRKSTKPTRGSIEKRLKKKAKRSHIKTLRGKISA